VKKFIFSNTPVSVQNHQLKAFAMFYDALFTSQRSTSLRKFIGRNDIAFGTSPPLLKVYKWILDFGTSETTKVKNQESRTEEFEIKNKGKEVIQFSIEPHDICTNEYAITISPLSGELKKNQSVTITVNFHLNKPVQKVQELLVIDIIGGARYYIGIHVLCEKKQFGIPPNQVEMVHVEGIGSVPRVLVHLRSILEKHDGFSNQGIFRLNGNDTLVKKMKAELNLEEYGDSTSMNEIANLIKIWFRELPEGVLDVLPAQRIIGTFY
jgi:hypothetical protein